MRQTQYSYPNQCETGLDKNYFYTWTSSFIINEVSKTIASSCLAREWTYWKEEEMR